jgi:hypothetical protein
MAWWNQAMTDVGVSYHLDEDLPASGPCLTTDPMVVSRRPAVVCPDDRTTMARPISAAL